MAVTARTPGTPSDATGPKAPARTRIERAAAALFYRRGIHATGVESIAQRAEVSKRTLYQHFPSKTELIAGYLRGFDAAGGTPLEQRLDDTTLPARERLLALFDVAGSIPGKVFRGCPYHNAAVESAGALADVDAIVHTHKQAFTARLVAVATEAGAAEPAALGRQLAVLLDGAAALATSVDDPAPFRDARAAAATLIDAARHGSRPSADG